MPSMRTHKKSRLGCGQCKRRRVKCDEAAPCCGPCTKKGIECEYKDLEGVPDKIRSIMQQQPQSCRSQPAELPLQCMGSEDIDGNESAAFSSEDMLLMHHFTLSTSLTIGILDDDTCRAIWQARVPVLACQYQHLLHALLSTTAAHMSDISTSRHHYSRAIELFSTLGTIESSDRQDSVFCYCVLMMLTTFALDCVRSDDLSACVAGLTGGFKMIRTAIGLVATFQNDLRAREMGQLLRHMDDPTHASSMPDETQVSLARLDYIIGTQRECTSAETRAVLREGLASLRLFFTRVSIRPTSWVNILQWPKALEHDFLVLVEDMDPAALAMVAHWCVPLHHAPHKWYAAGWPKTMILAIAERLGDGTWRESMAWPVTSIMNNV